MRLIIWLSLISTLSGCAATPKPPVIEKCVTVAVEGLAPYQYCRWSDGSGEPWRVPIMDANKFICTTPDGYAKAEQYAHELNNWINMSCKKGGQ